MTMRKKDFCVSLLKQQLEAVAAAVVKYKSEAAGELNSWGGQRDYIIF